MCCLLLAAIAGLRLDRSPSRSLIVVALVVVVVVVAACRSRDDGGGARTLLADCVAPSRLPCAERERSGPRRRRRRERAAASSSASRAPPERKARPGDDDADAPEILDRPCLSRHAATTWKAPEGGGLSEW